MDYDNLKAFLTKRYKQCRSAHAFKLSKCYEVCRWDLDAKHKENPRVIISDGTQLWAQLKPPVLTDINDYIADLIEKIDVVPHFVVTSGKREASAATQQRDEEEEMESEDVTEDKNHNKKKRKRDKKSDSWEMKPTNKRRKLNALSASTPSREQKLVPNMSEEEFYLDSLFTNVEQYDKWDFAAKQIVWIEFLQNCEFLQWVTKRELKQWISHLGIPKNEGSLLIFRGTTAGLVGRDNICGWNVVELYKENVHKLSLAVQQVQGPKWKEALKAMKASDTNWAKSPYKRGGRKKGSKNKEKAEKQEMMEVDDKSNILDLEPDENEEDKDGKDATTCAESGHFFVSRIYCRYCGKPGN
eukprot:63437_1